MSDSRTIRTPGGSTTEEVPRDIVLAFAPLHKRALGTAVGTAAALLVAAVTAYHMTVLDGASHGLHLLSWYFYGYEVSWSGALIGAGWAFFTGFVMGWFVAFCRNLVLAASLFLGRTREELRRTSGFLDHI